MERTINAALPQNDRELLLEVSGNMNKLADAMDGLAKAIGTIESKRIEPLEKKVDELQAWKDQFSGAYKLVLIFVSIGTIISLLKIFIK